MSKTTRIPDAWASGGAMYQDGKLPIYQCNICRAQVVWATSKRTGGRYLVNIRCGNLDQRFYAKNDFHRCNDPIHGGDGTGVPMNQALL